MTPEAQRIAIAEACGQLRWTNLDGKYYPDCPHYLTDLNAMHAAEEVLIRCSLFQDYWPWLEHITAKELRKGSCYFCRATAAQRAEAFLRTLGKWEEDAPE